MKKGKLIISTITITTILTITWIITYQYYPKVNSIEVQAKDQDNTWSTNSGVIENTWTKLEEDNENETSGIDAQKAAEEIEKLRNRLKLKWLIVKWDVYLKNEQPTLALKIYLEAYKESPEDEKIIKKIWNTYFEMEKFKEAYDYYKKIKDYGGFDKERAILTLFYSKDFNNIVDIKDVKKELKTLNLDKEETFYYENSLTCITDFHQCKKDLNTFLNENQKIENKNLLELKKAIENYQNFKTEEIYYKDALLAWAYYTNKLYPISIFIGKEILKEKNNYKPIMKIIARSQFEIWNYESSKKTLTDYYAIDESDSWVAFLLWVIDSKLHEYILSNIHLNKALELWYDPRIDVRRRLIHNYFMIWNTEKLLSEFEALVKEENAETEDLQLAIYYHIINDDLDFAMRWAKKWMEKFPDDDMFYGYLWWILKEKNKFEEANDILKKWLEINPRNPMILLNIWYAEKLQWNTNKSIVYFKKTVKLNPEWEFWQIAQDEIDTMEKEKEILKKSMLRND